jgi:transcriptional regulator with XRE-family HTH domain
MATLKDQSKRQSIRHELYQQLDTRGLPLAKAVKDLRKVLGLSQVEFAKLVGQSLSTLRKIEQDRGNVTLDTIYRILSKFSLELAVVRPVQGSKGASDRHGGS